MTPERKKVGGSRVERAGGERTRKKKKSRSKDEVIQRRVTILAIVAVVMLTLALGMKFWIREPNITPPPAPTGSGSTAGEAPANAGSRKDGVYTFLLLGRDTGGGGNTDTMMVASYDTKQQTLNVLNIYRDTMVNAPWDIKRINSVYNISGGGEKGIEALKGYLSDLIGFAPDYYVTIEWDAVGELVDAIDGVEFDVPYEMHYWDPTQNLRINQAKGYRTLNGDDAMQVIRWRKNNDGSKTSVGDIGRVEIQQNFLKAVLAKCLKTVNIATVPKYAQILLDNVTTDIPLGNMVWFGTQALGLNMENLAFYGLPGNLNGAAWSRTYKNYQSYVLPDGEAIVELVNTHFNPYREDVELKDLDIMSVNRDGSLSSSRGEVRDAKAAVAPVIPSKTPEKPAEEPGANTPPETQPVDPPAMETPEIPVESQEPAPSQEPELPPETEPSDQPEETDVPAATELPAPPEWEESSGGTGEPEIPPTQEPTQESPIETLPAMPTPVG